MKIIYCYINTLKNYVFSILFPTRRFAIASNNVDQKLLEKIVRIKFFKTTPPTYSIFGYRNKVIYSLIKTIKYEYQKDVIRIIAPVLADKFLKIFNNFTKIVILPVPLSKERQRFRGFNQTELIVRAMLLLIFDNKFEMRNDILFRIKDTKPQAEQKVNSRKNNLKGAFFVNKSELRKVSNGTIFVIFDDVTTTGETLREIYLEICKTNIVDENRIFGFAVAS